MKLAFRRLSTAIVFGLIGSYCCSEAIADNSIVSTFDTDLDGWTTDNSGSFEHVSSGGNSGGFLSLDNDEVGIGHIFAPGKFLGNLSSFDGGTISFDGNLLGNGGTFFNDSDDYGVIEITGTGGVVSLDLLPGGATPQLGTWETYSASLDASTWGVSQTQWSAVLADVSSVRITLEGLFGEESHGVDNVRLTAIPEPGSLVLLGIGTSIVLLKRRRDC